MNKKDYATRKAKRSLIIMALLFFAVALWKMLSSKLSVEIYRSDGSFITSIMSVWNGFNFLLYVFFAVCLIYKLSITRICIIPFISFNLIFTISKLIPIMNNNQIEIEQLAQYWFQNSLYLFFYVWSIFVLTRRDVQLVLDSNKQHEEIEHATANGDD